MVKKKIKKTSIKEISSVHCDSPSKKPELGCGFKVSLVPCVDESEKYCRWIKDCSWDNIVFVHPSVSMTFRCDLLLVKGKSTISIFIPYFLKMVKKSCVVIQKNMGFEHDEEVQIYPFKGNAFEAGNVCIHIQPDIVPTDYIRDLVWKQLCNRFIWLDLKLMMELCGIKYEITVTKVQFFSQIVLRNFYQQSFCNTEYTPFDDSLPQLHECSSSHDCSSIQPNSFVAFSPVLLKNFSENAEAIKTLPLQEESSSFFILTCKTSITFTDVTVKPKPGPSPFYENVNASHELHSVKKVIDDFFIDSKQKALNQPHVLLLISSLEREITSKMNFACSEYQIHVEEIILSKLHFKTLADLLEELKRKFRIANERAPCIIILHKFEDLCAMKYQSSLVLNTLSNLIETCDSRILIITSLVDNTKYDKKIFNSCFIHEMKIVSPSSEEIIQESLAGIKHNLTSCQIKQCAELSQGLKRKELHVVLKYAELLSFIRAKNMNQSKGEKVLNFCDVKSAMRKIKPGILSSNLISKKVKWEDIGGMTEIKEKLKEELKLFQMCDENVKRFNYEHSKGILLYGPPGCSKTMIAQALANECNWNFISKKSSEILNMYVGESEKAVTKLFVEARARSPCIVFLDEIDALVPERTSCSTASGVQNRVVNALLTEIAGVETLKDIIVMAATNRPDVVDKAFLRSGRMGLHIYVPLPDADSRQEIFRLCLKRKLIASDVDLGVLVELTNGYTGAEIVHVCNEAAMQLMTDNKFCESTVFTMSHFERAIQAVPPRTTKETIQFYEQFKSR